MDLKHKRTFFLGLILILFTVWFWTQSRYPQLNEKEQMSGRIRVNEALSFDIVFPVHDKDPLYKKITYSIINWSYTNKKGMIFGVLFAAIFLTLLQTISTRPKSKNRFLHSFIGLLIGAPLGVCANCVAPVGQGMFKSGEKPETILATIHSSPSLNIIVVVMLFNLFPMDFAIIKIFFNLFFILVMTPLLTKIFAKDIKTVDKLCPLDFSPGETWAMAIKESLKGFKANLFYILKKTVPLMLLAGALGSTVIETFDINFLQRSQETFLLYFSIALLGTFLPVPIAFDLVLSFVLMKSGLAMGPTMVFLFCLGMFSIYPFFIIFQTLSKKLAVGVFVSTMLVGMLAGFTVKIKNAYSREKDLQTIDEMLKSLESKKIKRVNGDGKKLYSLIKASCSQHDSPIDQDQCLKDNLFKEIVKTDNYHLCLVDGQTEEKKGECLDRTIEHFLSLGKIKKDICAEVDPLLRKECLLRFVLFEKALKYKEIKYCDKLKPAFSVDKCRSTFVDYFITKGESLEFCHLKKDPMLIEQCVQFNIGNRIHSGGSKGFSSCLLFPTKEGKENCILTLHYINFERPSPLYCEKVKDPAWKKRCFDLKETIKVIEKGGPIDYCSKKLTPPLTFVCYEELIKKKLKMTNDPQSICKNFPDPNQCLVESNAFIHRRDGVKSAKDLCGLPEGKEAKDQCLSKVIYSYMSHFDAIGYCMEQDRAVFVNQECQTGIINEFKKNKLEEKICDFFPQKELINKCKKNIIFMKARLGSIKKCDLLPLKEKKKCHNIFKSHKIKLELKSKMASLYIPSLLKGLKEKSNQKIKKDLPKKVETKKVKAQTFLEKENLLITKFPYFEKSEKGSSNKQFQKVEGHQIGLDYSYGFSALENFEPFKMGKGIASGDFNNDFWPDLAVSSEQGLHLYLNKGQGHFKRVPFNPPSFKGIPFLTSFVDINNDGWKDLFVSTYGGGNYFFLNHKGEFKETSVDISDPKNIILTISGAFSDIDKDGDLDFFQGNWSFGEVNFMKANLSTSINRIYTNQGKAPFFKRTNFKDNLKGETLSSLFSDINSDGHIDLLTGNDFAVPDGHYLGKGNGQFDKIKKSDKLIPEVSHFTMSLDSADINNDLNLDIFSGEMAFFGHQSDKDYCKHIKNKKSKQQCQKHFLIRALTRKRDIKGCSQFEGLPQRNCILTMLIEMMLATKDIKNCEKIPTHLKEAQHLCRRLFELKKIHEKESTKGGHRDFNEEDLVQTMSNILLVSDGKGRFKNMTKEAGVGNSFWSWNAKFSDLDNDSWQDIYVGNGFLLNDVMTSNVFFHNQKGKKFLKKEKEFGLEDFIHTHSYTYLDYDLDGDIDIISTGSFAPLRLFKNNLEKGSSLSFSFVDEKGNRDGIGNKITLFYGKNKHQIREIKLGGGFLSFDRPWAHFGLGDYKKIDKVEIEWSTGEKTHLEKEFLTGHHYIIKRKK